MRNLLNIEATARARREFTHEDIAGVLFLGRPPIVTDTPFTRSSSLSLQKLPVTFGLLFFDDLTQGTALDLLTRILYKDSSAREYAGLGVIQNLPPWGIIEIAKTYSSHQKSWQEYFQREIPSFCKTQVSRYYWSLLEKIGPGEVFPARKEAPLQLSTEQRLWVYYCDQVARGDMAEFAIALRDSILPWLNLDMHKAVQKKLENTRENTAYDQQKANMALGVTSSDDDLDIVK